MSKEEKCIDRTGELRSFKKVEELNKLLDDLDNSISALYEKLEPFSIDGYATENTTYATLEVPDVKFLRYFDNANTRVIGLIHRLEAINNSLGI